MHAKHPLVFPDHDSYPLLSIIAVGSSWASAPRRQGRGPGQKRRRQQRPAQQAKEKSRAQAATSVEITVTAPRVEIPLKKNPAATTVVETPILGTMPRTIAIDEALKLVPGVKVDNQADGERVHLSIRGEGILTERGTRGIKTLVDGIPLNDPSGYVSDFYDIDWTAVRRLEVLRGPAAAFYGSGSSGRHHQRPDARRRARSHLRERRPRPGRLRPQERLRGNRRHDRRHEL